MLKDVDQKQNETDNKQLIQTNTNMLSDNYYYPENYKEKEIKDSDVPMEFVKFHNILGQNSSRRYNYYFLNDEEIITAVANTFQIININGKSRKVFHGTQNSGIGCLSVDPKQKYFSIAECGEWPNIYIYEFDSSEQLSLTQNSIKLYRILRKGSERGFSAVNFNPNGDKLASVGKEPDYNLIIWNWKNETIILKAKAFSQEVLNVRFSLNFEGKLISSGVGHIKFWEMAKTFTGLKLQGELGKFGHVDLSDVSAFVEFPDGKVLCGTEYGTFLLWEGIFIKAHVMVGEGIKCHNGFIEYMAWDYDYDYHNIKNDIITSNNFIISGAHDGYLKWWSYSQFENLVIDDSSISFLNPFKEVLLINPITKQPIRIVNLVKQKFSDSFLIQDSNGYFLKIDNLVLSNLNSSESDSIKITSVYEFHSGSIMKISLISPFAFIQGSDSNTSLFNFNNYNENENYFKNFAHPKFIQLSNLSNLELFCTACDTASRESSDDFLIYAIGYSIGLFRIYQFDSQNTQMQLVNQIRAHDEAISHIYFSPDKSYLLTATKNEIFIFFVFELDRIVPHCCFSHRNSNITINDIDWHFDSQRILVGYSSGLIEEIEIPKTYDNTKSYLVNNYISRKFNVKLADRQLEKEDEKKKRRKKEVKIIQEPSPSAVISCRYANFYHKGDFFITADTPFNDYLYLCDFEITTDNPNQRPLNFWKLPKNDVRLPVNSSAINEYKIKYISKNFIFISTIKGSLQIHHKSVLDKYIEIFPNLLSGSIQDINVSEDEKILGIGCKDGTYLLYEINKEAITKYLENITVITTEKTGTESGTTNTDNKEISLFASQFATYDDNILSSIKKEIFTGVNIENITNNGNLTFMNSLENEKKNDQEREKVKQADEKKNDLKLKIQKLRDDFNKVTSLNMSLPEEIRLTDDEIIVDEQYLNHIRSNTEMNLADIKHKYDWLKANVEYTIDKIKSFLKGSELTPKVYVYSLRSKVYVTTLRCANLPSDFYNEMQEVSNNLKKMKDKVDLDYLEEQYEKYLSKKNINKEFENTVISNTIERIEERLNNYYLNIEKDNSFQAKRADFKKNLIKEELGLTGKDLEDLKDLFEEKMNIAGKLKEYLDYREKRRYVKSSKTVHSQIEQIRSPDNYSSKINFDTYFTEVSMKTTLNHKMLMYEYLEVLFKERTSFNESILNLRKSKEELIKILQSKKEDLIGIENGKMEEGGLTLTTEYDWLDFEMIDQEYPEREYELNPIEVDYYCNQKSEYMNSVNISNNLKENYPKLTGEISKTDNYTVRERKRQVNDGSSLLSELRSINQIKYEYKKKKIIEECEKLINDFDHKVQELKKQKLQISFKQKIGELELEIKHEEYNILRAFETDDNTMIRKVEDLYYQYTENLRMLRSCFNEIESKEEEERRLKLDLDAKNEEFTHLIEKEKDSQELLWKVYSGSRKIEIGSIQDDKIEHEEELDFPRNISQQLKQDIISLRDAKISIDDNLTKLRNYVNTKNKEKQHLIITKGNMDKRRSELREKINQNERKKMRYLNLIDFAVPLKLNQFCKLDVIPVEKEGLNVHKLPIDISKSILISQSKLANLKNRKELIKTENKNLEKENLDFDDIYDELEKIKKSDEKNLKLNETEFENDLKLKFGLLIDFNYLLKASENKTIDKLETEYRKMKKEADRQIDECKESIDNMKSELQEQLKENTNLLNEIRELLEVNKKHDIKLEEKNNEINKKSNKKFTMYNIKEKKEKLKEILKLLEQQMEALKKEIEIFRRKGGHIYSTIASNLN